MILYGNGKPTEKAAEMFDEYDVDRNGNFTREEFAEMVKLYFTLLVDAAVGFAAKEEQNEASKTKLEAYQKSLSDNQEAAAAKFAGLLFSNEEVADIPKATFIEVMNKNHALLTSYGFRKFVLEAK
jgi:hypothetical protein